MSPESTSLAINGVDDKFVINFAWKLLRANNPELPKEHYLSEGHVKALAESGITPTHAAYAGIFTADAIYAKATIGHEHAGLMFAYLDPSGILYKYRDAKDVERPFMRLRPDDLTGAKYLSPKGSSPFVYVPRVADFKWIGDIGGKIKGGFDLVITEGEKKALCATLNGYPCFGLGGVDSFATGPKVEGESGEKPRRELGFFIEEINLLEQSSVTLCYDNDVTLKPGVREAIKRFNFGVVESYREKDLADGLQHVRRVCKFGDILKYVILPIVETYKQGSDTPTQEKIGLDDAFLKWGKRSMKQLFDNAMPLCKVVPHKEDPKDVSIAHWFNAEPLGDASDKKMPAHCQATSRSVMGMLCMKDKLMRIDGQGSYQYSEKKGYWESVYSEAWKSIPDKVAITQKWQNRGKTLADQMLSLCSSELAAKPEDLNPVEYLAFKNGVLDRRSGELIPMHSSLMITHKLGFDFDPEATCPTFDRWMLFTQATLLPDGTYHENDEATWERIKLIRALLSFTLTPKTGEAYPVEVFPFVVGPPKRGKGCLSEVLSAMCGSAAAAWQIDDLINANALFGIAGKLAAINTELKGSFSSGAVAAVNKLSSNEALTFKKLFKDVITARANTVLWAFANNPPALRNGDRGGLDRRLLLVPFDREVLEPLPNFKADLLSELSGIYNWVAALPYQEAVQIIIDRRKSDDYFQAQTESLSEQNSVYAWMVDPDDSNMEVFCEKNIPYLAKTQFAKYVKWCGERQILNYSITNFTRILVVAGAKKKPVSKGTTYTIPGVEELRVKDILGM